MKPTRPLEWLVGYWLVSILGAAGPAWVAHFYFSIDWRLVASVALSFTLGTWASAGMLYREPGQANHRWAKRFTSFGQGCAVAGMACGLIGLLVLIGQWLASRI